MWSSASAGGCRGTVHLERCPPLQLPARRCPAACIEGCEWCEPVITKLAAAWCCPPSPPTAASSGSTSSSLPRSTPGTTATGACSRCGLWLQWLMPFPYMLFLWPRVFGIRVVRLRCWLRPAPRCRPRGPPLAARCLPHAVCPPTGSVLARRQPLFPPKPSRSPPFAAPQVFGEALQDLQTDYVDLMLLHYPG